MEFEGSWSRTHDRSYRLRVLLPLKTRRVEWLTHAKSIEAQSLHVGVKDDASWLNAPIRVTRQTTSSENYEQLYNLSKNPHVIVEKQMRHKWVTVWCGIRAGGIIRPYFFENDAGQAMSIIGTRYRFLP
ncbi:hypothetical protein TNCV_13051 [Trichonephila clavipes]|nr:hypothetical protein TNCV_13051 [Trichonephila clavipes]